MSCSPSSVSFAAQSFWLMSNVCGDVHEVGKLLVGSVLRCNNYTTSSTIGSRAYWTE
jgi:cobalamin-dependent methionine synthase I